MRKIDIEKNQDFNKELVNAYLRIISTMAFAFEKQEKYLINRINELESKIKKLKGGSDG